MKGSSTQAYKRLTRKQRSYLRAKLMEKRRQLLAQLEGGLSRTNQFPSDGMGGDLLDLAQDHEEIESSFQIAEIESSAVDAIENAIERLDEGTYGLCEVCGQPIPPARLRVLPSAALCVRCKQSEEAAGGGRGASAAYERLRDVPSDSYDPEQAFGSVRGRKVS